MSTRFLTSTQNITLNLIFAFMEERRWNRNYSEYVDIAARLPPLKDLTFQVNRLLQQLHKCNDECNGFILPEICRFKAGDKRIIYEPYPKKISKETIREALVVSGMREPRWSKTKSF
jgi:hypothetical protein